MRGEFSWLVLVAAFVMVTGLCGILAARLGRVGSSGEPAPRAEPVRDPGTGSEP
jgi:hypothetical protein